MADPAPIAIATTDEPTVLLDRANFVPAATASVDPAVPPPLRPLTGTADPLSPVTMLSNVLNLLNLAPTGVPTGPVDSPAMWAMLAFVRRQFETLANQQPIVPPTEPVFTSLTVPETVSLATLSEPAPVALLADPAPVAEVDEPAVLPVAALAEPAMLPATDAMLPATEAPLTEAPLTEAPLTETAALTAAALASPLAARSLVGEPTEAALVAEPLAAAAIISTPYLPFDMPVGVTDRKVFAHYMPSLPISPDNLPADQDYYTTQYLNPLGENGVHAPYGGYMRDRPLPRDPINSPDWKYQDLLTEVNQAKSVGIDGFTVDILLPSAQDETVRNLLRAAENTPDFSIQPTADMVGWLGDFTPEQFATEFAPYLASPGAFRLSDGRPVLGSFYAERQTAQWWGEALDSLRDDHGLDVAFVPTFLNAPDNMESFAPISYGFSNWGARNPLQTDPTSAFPGLPADLTDRAHDLGKIWMQPVAFQDNRPREGIYEESGNTLLNANNWTSAINNEAEWVQLVTWNDYAETTAMAPSVEHGYRMMDLQAYSIAQFKYGDSPQVLRDALYVSHRDQFAASESTYEETIEMTVRPGTTPATDTVDVIVFATAPATVYASIGGVVESCAVGGGRSTCSFPLRTGDVIVGLERDGQWQTMVQSPYNVTDTPYVQDLQYHVSGGLR